MTPGNVSQEMMNPGMIMDLSILLQKSRKRESLPHFHGVRLSNGVVIKDSRFDFFQSTSGSAGQISSHFRHTARPPPPLQPPGKGARRLLASNAGCSVNRLDRFGIPVVER